MEQRGGERASHKIENNVSLVVAYSYSRLHQGSLASLAHLELLHAQIVVGEAGPQIISDRSC